MLKTNKFLLLIVSLFLALSVRAQSQADKLFMEGQQLQKTMTVASQNAAIKKFNAAKVIYTTAAKKKMCSNQIAICMDNKRRLSKPSSPSSASSSKPKAKKSNETDDVRKETVAAVVKEREVNLALSEVRLDFKCNPKEGYTQSVEVDCNYDDWEIKSKPEWTTVYTTTNKFSVEVDENETEEDRSGIITVKCGKKEVVLVVNQDKANTFDKIKGKIGGIFKKKKKK